MTLVVALMKRFDNVVTYHFFHQPAARAASRESEEPFASQPPPLPFKSFFYKEWKNSKILATRPGKEEKAVRSEVWALHTLKHAGNNIQSFTFTVIFDVMDFIHCISAMPRREARARL
jgi:hypothetical protein